MVDNYKGPCPWLFWRIPFDLLAWILAFLPYLLLTIRNAQPFQRGFFCDDESLRYPYRPDTVSVAALYLGILLIPTGIVLITELIRSIYEKESSGPEAPAYGVSRRCSIPRVFVLLYSILGTFYFGFAIVMSLVDIGKFSAGRLEPYFIAVCQPDPSSYSCMSNLAYAGNTSGSTYVQTYTCTGTNTGRIWGARLGFPSRHAALSAFAAFFLLIYLEVRLTWRPIRMLVRVLQAGCIGACIYISITRISDNVHFASDVIAGVILGIFVAVLVIWRVSLTFRPRVNPAKVEVEATPAVATATVETTESPINGPGMSYATAYYPMQSQLQGYSVVTRVNNNPYSKY